MRQLVDLLEDFTLTSAEKDFKSKPKHVEDFGHLIAEESVVSGIELREIKYKLKYRGNLNNIFYLSIRRIFFAKILIKDESGTESLFEREIALKGKYHLKKIGNGEIEILSSSPYSKFGNTIRKLSKPEDTPQLEVGFMDFSLEEFLKL